MSPRHNRQRRGGRKRSPGGPPRDDTRDGEPGGARVESWPDGDWMVRPVTGSAATKSYRCPGCDQLIAAGTPHLVSWPAELAGQTGQTGEGGLDSRRHWHRPCWQARDRRRANLQRSRNAPRYG